MITLGLAATSKAGSPETDSAGRWSRGRLKKSGSAENGSVEMAAIACSLILKHINQIAP